MEHAISHPLDPEVTQAVTAYLDHAMHRTRHHIFKSSRATGLSFTQIAIVRRLHWQGEASAGELSEFLDISRAALSQAVDKLVDEGLVERTESEQDRRVKIHRIAEAGRKMVATVHDGRFAWLESELSTLSTADQDLVRRAFAALMTSAGNSAASNARSNPDDKDC